MKPSRLAPTMTKLILTVGHGMALAGLTLTPLSSGAAEKPATPAGTNEPAVVLSPFTVITERDTGFIASSSLAGGRLATDLIDTPVAYSVITRDFIDALGITDLGAAALWSPNVSTPINGNVGSLYNDISTSPQNYTVRGASQGGGPSGGGGNLRNFFPASLPMLSYSMERYDFGRGPNAVLFGNGSLGGVSSATTKIAKVGQNFSTLRQEFGSWSYLNTTLDVNRSLSERFAVRAAATNLDRQGFRDREMERNHAAFLTGTFKFSRDTSLRLEGEYGTTARHIPGSLLNDRFSGWDGKTTYNGRLDTLPGDANAIGVNRKVRASTSNAAGAIIYNPYAGAIYNYDNQPITLAGGSTAQTPLGGFVQGTLPNFGGFPMSVLAAKNAPAGRFNNAIAGSAFRVPSQSFSLAKDVPELQQRFNDVQLTFDHRFGNFFLQLAADKNRNDLEAHTVGVRGGQDIYIDINRVNPDGTSNSQFLQPYTDGQLRKNLTRKDMDGFRLAGGYYKDAGVWGKYTASLQGGVTRLESSALVYSMSIAQNADHRRWGAAAQTIGQTDLIRIRSSIFDRGARPYETPASVRYIDPLTGVDKMITPIWALELDRSDSVQTSLARFNYGMAALNAKFWKDRIVVLGAMRKDSFSNDVSQTIDGGDYSANSWDGVTPFYRPSAPADYATLTYVPKTAQGAAAGGSREAANRPRDANGTPLPQYVNDRFKSDYNGPITKTNVTTYSYGSVVHLTKWLSAYGNYAETFNPPLTIQRIDSTFLKSTVAKGTDFGLRSRLLDGLLNLNVVRYQNSEQNNPFDPGIQNQINPILQSQALGNPGGIGRNIRGLANVPATMRDMQDRKATGWEFELVANLTQSWRTMVNIGVPKIYSVNRFQDSKKYLDANLSTLKQVVIDTGGLVDAANVATVNRAIAINDQSPDVNTAVSNWNSLQTAILNFAEGPRSPLDQQPMSINVFSDYTFKTGLLKGFSFGAGMQYRGRRVLGNRGADTIVNPANPLAAIDDPAVDRYTPVYGAPYRQATVTAGYVFRLQEKRTVTVRLRVENALDDRSVLYSGTVLRPRNGDYTSPARETVPGNNIVIRNPISFYLSAEIKI